MDQAPRKKALRTKKSLNQTVIEELSQATLTLRKVEDFTDLCGQWVADPGFDEVIAFQRSIDLEKWK